MNNKAITAVAAIVGVICLVVGVMYFTQTADHLPSFFPGHASAPTPDKHMKHGIAATVVAVCLFIFAWFSSGKKSTA